MVPDERHDERRESQGHASAYLRAAIVLVPAKVAMKQVAFNRHRHRENLPDLEDPDGSEARVALAIGGVAPPVADATDPRLGCRNGDKTRPERDQQFCGGRHK